MTPMPPRVAPRHKQTQYTRTFIREWREKRGLSQDQLVERARERVATFSKSTLSRLENAQQAYTQPILEVLAWALSVEVVDLLIRHPNSEFWSIVDNLKEVGEEDRPRVARLIKDFRKVS